MKETVTYKDIRGNKEINQLIEKGNEILGVLGYTEHSKKHAAKVAETAAGILKDLGYGSHEMELARIAGYMHDIGNSINRHDHAHSGAILAYQILKDLGMPLRDIVTITGAIGHHDEATGTAIDVVSAALILADRDNYAALSATLKVNTEKRVIQMDLELDDAMSTVMDYFEIFLQRMMMCRRAAEVLGLKFKLVANGSRVS